MSEKKQPISSGYDGTKNYICKPWKHGLIGALNDEVIATQRKENQGAEAGIQKTVRQADQIKNFSIK